MATNQAFEILRKAGGVRAARIVLAYMENKEKRIKKEFLFGRFFFAVYSFFFVRSAKRLLRKGVPVAKIIGEKWFYGLPFCTNKWTLDPRPDSEALVGAVIAENAGHSPLRILDLGTGTGCLISAIAANLPNAAGVGIDKSARAARVAKRNVENLGLADRIRIMRGDFESGLAVGKFDIIVSNPPYIAAGDARLNIGARHDPKIALYAGDGGLAAYKAIARNARAWIRPHGKIYLEIGRGQGDDARDIFARMGWAFLKSWNDLAGIERVLSFKRLAN
ncbi:MAG: peptide chain release factor N(5)-glutamine methyltransferase [Rickettsiales bacterium]|jgi:release factor glutamine methyltransferase|nr:peptide chain release factor N(5)-glutamine methyltransferase [Rickettsiales bacterium]